MWSLQDHMRVARSQFILLNRMNCVKFLFHDSVSMDIISRKHITWTYSWLMTIDLWRRCPYGCIVYGNSKTVKLCDQWYKTNSHHIYIYSVKIVQFIVLYNYNWIGLRLNKISKAIDIYVEQYGKHFWEVIT